MKSLFILCLFCCECLIYTSTSAQVDSVRNSAGDSVSVIMHRNAEVHLYRMNYLASSAICLVATAADIYAIPYVIKNKQDLTMGEINGLNKNAFSAFDRWALNQDPSQRNMYMKASDYTLPVIIATPAILGFDKAIKKDWFRILLMYYEMHSITFSIYNYSPFGPAFQNKYRPVTYYDQIPLGDRMVGNNRNSMYSGHTATAVASTFFLVKVYSDYHPEIGNKKYLLYVLATLPAFAEGYLRVKGLEHFPSDVMMGMGIGIACGILVPEVHRFKNHKVQVGLSGTPVGPGVDVVWRLD